MKKREEHAYRMSLEHAVLLLVTVLLLLIVACQYMPINITIPVVILSFVGILAGLFLPTIIATWVMILATVIGFFLVILGYVLIPVYERTVLVLTAPSMLAFASLIKRRAHGVANVKLSERTIMRYLRRHDIITDLPNNKEANSYYTRNIRLLENYQLKTAEFSTTLIYWAHNEQYEQLDPDEANEVLRDIARHLQKLRLPSEHLYYLKEGYYLVISPVARADLLKELNHHTVSELEKLTFITDEAESQLQFQCASLIITRENVSKWHSYGVMLKRLFRIQETDIIREYQ